MATVHRTVGDRYSTGSNAARTVAELSEKAAWAGGGGGEGRVSRSGCGQAAEFDDLGLAGLGDALVSALTTPSSMLRLNRHARASRSIQRAPARHADVPNAQRHSADVTGERSIASQIAF